MTAYNLKLFEQKYFPKRFPHKISSEAIKKWTYLIISAIWYRPYRCFGTADSRCRIFRSGGVVPLKLSFFDIMVQQRV